MRPEGARVRCLKRLIVTADDLGLVREVNDAVDAAHRDGVLTAASLMLAAPAAVDARERARPRQGAAQDRPAHPDSPGAAHRALRAGAPATGARRRPPRAR